MGSMAQSVKSAFNAVPQLPRKEIAPQNEHETGTFDKRLTGWSYWPAIERKNEAATPKILPCDCECAGGQ
ncbi:hypothetical protein EVAR_6333_1 [Eumeta japonica]|uniref:Uncharacterized protein n=1 Tax=Eumeta variegata TaxID=151549 RepID=A0A4C1TBK2_EUMVA|nr:hypothetical protein EVAR_6333_1 [Eumeta japonica]